LNSKTDVEDWTRVEKVALSYDLTSTVDTDLLFPTSLMSRLEEKAVQSVHSISPGMKGIGWFVIVDVVQRKTKKGKIFYRLRVTDHEHKTAWLRVWGAFEKEPEKYTLWMAHVSNDPNWGMSSSVAKLRRVA